MLLLLHVALGAPAPVLAQAPTPPNPPNPSVTTAQVGISGNVYWRTDARFKSWNIDASENRGWEVRNLSQPKLRYLAAASLPGYLRFGGTGNDKLIYGVGNITKCSLNAEHCLNESHFDDFMGLAAASKAKLIFGLSISPRSASGVWDPTEARALMAYGRAHFGDDAFFGFELGNEKEEMYSAHRCVHDFEILRTVIDEVWADVEPARRPKLVGPDPHGFHTSPIERVEPLQYLHDFAVRAAEVGLPMFAMTHHEYVEVEEYSAHPPNSQVLDFVGGIAAQVNSTLRGDAGLGPTTMIFAGETGPHNGKSPGVVSDKSMRWANFADVFWYIDAMGSKAKHGYSAFCRQDFVGIDYGMIDPETNDPLPDFYAGILWSQHMGTGVIRAISSANQTVRAYAHCAPDEPNSGLSTNGDLTVILLNLASSSTPTTSVTLSGIEGCGPKSCARTEWLLSGPHGTNSTSVALNGVLLALDASGKVPEMPGNQVAAANSNNVFPLPAATVAFLRFSGAGRGLGCR